MNPDLSQYIIIKLLYHIVLDRARIAAIEVARVNLFLCELFPSFQSRARMLLEPKPACVRRFKNIILHH